MDLNHLSGGQARDVARLVRRPQRRRPQDLPLLRLL
jgi:hypothetical protein